MAQPSTRRTINHPLRALSIFSTGTDSDVTPRTTPAPIRRRTPGSWALRSTPNIKLEADAPSPAPDQDQSHTHDGEPATSKRPAHYNYPPTVPSPFIGTLETTLDAILEFGRMNPELNRLTTTMLEEVKAETNWPAILRTLLIEKGRQRGRELLEELLFLVTRTLLPEQIAENRALMARLFNARKSLAMKLLLRYDMMRQWVVTSHAHVLTLASDDPPSPLPIPPAPLYIPQHPRRRPLMPNILCTLVSPPPEGYATLGVKDKMKHHATELDTYLLLTDEEVEGWSEKILVLKLAEIVLQWQWLRENNEIFSEMEVHGWSDLDGKADENEWFWTVERKGGGKAAKRAMGDDYDDDDDDGGLQVERDGGGSGDKRRDTVVEG